MLPHCEEVVKPMDVSPERSPQAAHTALLEHMSGKDVAEIGTRRGDGMLCFALAARSALAIEVRPNYCSMLEERAANWTAQHEGQKSYSVLCQAFQEAPSINASLYTWWQGPPHLNNIPAICSLNKMQRLGRVPAHAEAMPLFDLKERADVRDLNHLKAKNIFSWTQSVAYDEKASCVAAGRKDCVRAHGSFIIGNVKLHDERVAELCKPRGRRLAAARHSTPGTGVQIRGGLARVDAHASSNWTDSAASTWEMWI